MFTIVTAEPSRDCEDSYPKICPFYIKQCAGSDGMKKACPKTCETCNYGEYRYEVVEWMQIWSDARKFCMDKGGDLIQNPKVFTLQGRNELSESLNLPTERYHVGITKDDNGVWRRVSDGEEIELDGWYPGSPNPADHVKYLVWVTHNNPHKNKIYNSLGHYAQYFICEYKRV